MSEPAIDRRIADLGTRIAATRLDPEARDGDGLASLVREIEACCGAICALPHARGDSLRPQLVGLLGELDRLSGAMSLDRRDAAARLNDLAKHRRARSAYGPARPR